MKTPHQIFSLLLALIVLGAMGCKEPKPVVPEPVETPGYTGKLKSVWQVPLSSPMTRSDTTQYISIPALITGDQQKVIFSRQQPLAPSPEGDEIFFALNAANGKGIWIQDNPPWKGASSGTYLQDGLIIHNSFYDIHAIHENTGEVAWSYFINTDNGWGGGYPFNVIDGWMYHIHKYSPLQRPDTASLMRSHIHNNQEWDTVYTAVLKNGYHPYPRGQVVWQHSSGDDIVLFQDGSYNVPLQKIAINLVAYNVTADSLYWRRDSLGENCKAHAPFIYNGKAYLPIQHALLCFDIETGQLLWTKDDFDSNDWLVISNITAAEGKLLFQSSRKKMYALDPDTGAVIWVTDNLGETPSELTYHDGIVYYSSSGNGRLYAIRVSNGEVIWAEKSPNNHIDSRAIFTTRVTIHPELKLLYVHDSFFAMAIQLPE